MNKIEYIYNKYRYKRFRNIFSYRFDCRFKARLDNTTQIGNYGHRDTWIYNITVVWTVSYVSHIWHLHMEITVKNHDVQCQ